ncbi:MAG: hypothetical protein AAF153_03345, partial [Pseudomonadota bacterium]
MMEVMMLDEIKNDFGSKVASIQKKVSKAIKIFVVIIKISFWSLVINICLGLIGSSLGYTCIGQSVIGDLERTIETHVVPANGLLKNATGGDLNYTSNYNSAIIDAYEYGKTNAARDHFGEWYKTSIAARKKSEISFVIDGSVYLRSGDKVKKYICPQIGTNSLLDQGVNTNCAPTSPGNAFTIGPDTVASINNFGTSSCRLMVIDEFNSPDASGNNVIYDLFQGTNCKNLSPNYNNMLTYKIDDVTSLSSNDCADYVLSNMIGMNVSIGNREIFNGKDAVGSNSKGAYHVPRFGLEINGEVLKLGGEENVTIRPVDPPSGFTLQTGDDFEFLISYFKKRVDRANPKDGTKNGALEVYISTDN